MANFPTLTESGVNINPSFPISEQRVDNVIRNEFEGGYEQTRAVCDRVRKVWKVTYKNLTSANKVLIDAFVDTVAGGADSFQWTNSQDNVTYTVRFAGTPNNNYISYNRWDVDFTLRQV